MTEAAVAIIAGHVASSIALIGFGADSMIESLSGAILLWRLQTHADEKRERIALRLVGASFLVLALYVSGDALWSLFHREESEKSVVGIVLAALSLIVMPLLARAKRRVARRLNSRALHADSRQTDICAYLSAILLGWKPAAAVYLHAAQVARVKPEELALVAAHDWDINGAGRAGLTAGYVARKQPICSPAMKKADVVGQSLTAVVQGLLALNA